MEINNYQKEFLRQEYIRRINKVVDYIDKHFDEELTLDVLADVASFSRFHFHRLFSAMTGETVNGFIKRVRLERAASMLMVKSRQTITEIAFQCGFSGNAVFTRAFNEYFQMSPTMFRNGGYKELSKIRKLHSNIYQTQSNSSNMLSAGTDYFRPVNFKQKTDVVMKVEVKEMPEMHVAYVRHIGNYSEVGPAFGKLMRWAGPRGLVRPPETRVLALYHDDPEVTEEKNLRTSVCITVPEGTKTDGDVGTMIVEGGKYACGHFEITEDQFQEAWNTMMRDWLPESGYQCADRLPYELYYNNHEEHPEKKHILDICIPVKPL